ncbi:hypothetical protein [Microbacterium gilvum]|uniref:Uncharacterized protein n=1 Tax=Microbacterium gilvum TaxID=1336204 RepID=A0ABP8ZQK1_9MICO
MSKLNTTVVLQDPARRTVILGSDSEIPEWAERAITNPDVWEEAPERGDWLEGDDDGEIVELVGEPVRDERFAEAEHAVHEAGVSEDAAESAALAVLALAEAGSVSLAEAAGAVAAALGAFGLASQEGTGEQSVTEGQLAAPPKSGNGSSADAWRAYGIAAAELRGLNIEIPEGASRSEIVEALEGAGIPTE